jgi:glutamate/tyrosine decarboxylase-like PLP-dependent enzyme
MDSTLDPTSWPEFRRQAHQMLDDALGYLEHVRERPVWRPIPPEVRAGFREPLPRSPTPLAAVHERFLREISPFATGNVHPGFMGWVHGGGTAVGVVAELLAASLNANLGGRDHVPIEVERQVVTWMRELLGFPDSASGLFVTGSSMANFIALLVARTGALGPDVRRDGVAAGGRRLTGYACTTAHRCVKQAFELAGLGSAALRTIPADSRHRMDLAALRASVQADRKAGYTPFLVVGTAGTVDVGAIDDLASLADLASEERLWFHVDGAFGALGMLAPDVAPRLAGIERADSVALDFHKWAQVPYDAGFVLVRDGALHRATFAAPAPYLTSQPRGLAAGAPWPSEFGPDLSRGFRALKTWFTLKVYGADRLGAVISRTCALARQLAGKIAAAPALELLAPVELNIVCFRYRSADADRVNAEIVADLHESGIAAPSTTTVQGRLAIRAALVNHRTEPRDLDALIEATIRFGTQRARED